jgi:hypothetical protein
MLTFPADLTILTPRTALRGVDGLENLITNKLSNGCLCLVIGLGLYEFQRNSTVTDPGGASSPVVAPIAGPGRWVQLGTLLAGGIVPLSWWIGDGIYFDDQTPLPGTWEYVQNVGLWVQQSATPPTDLGEVGVQLPYYGGRTLNSVTLTVNGGTGHAGLPAILPVATVTRRPIGDVTADLTIGLPDPSGDVPSYEATHTIVFDETTNPANFPLAMDPGNLFQIVLTGEQGANALDGQFRLLACEIDVT